MSDEQAIKSTVDHFNHVSADDIEWIIKHYEAAKEQAGSKPPAFDIFATETQDTLWQLLRDSIGSLEGVAIQEFTQDQPRDAFGNPLCHQPIRPRHYRKVISYISRHYKFVGGDEIIIKSRKEEDQIG